MRLSATLQFARSHATVRLRNLAPAKLTPFAALSPYNCRGISNMAGGSLLFRQLFEKESSTYTYLLADVGHPDKPAVLVDPVDKTADRDINLIKELGLKLIYAMNTHVHADHVTGTGLLKSKMPGVKSVISEASKAKADIFVNADDKIYFGNLFLEEKALASLILGWHSPEMHFWYVVVDGLIFREEVQNNFTTLYIHRFSHYQVTHCCFLLMITKGIQLPL